MANVPSTSSSFERRGCDQVARRPWRNATSRRLPAGLADHNRSLEMSEFLTGSFRNAAVPHQPVHGPILNVLMASVHPLKTRRPGEGHNLSPSESISRTEEIISGECASTPSHKSCKVSASAAPPEINSRLRLSADKSVSRGASFEAWPASFSFGPLEADGAGSRLEDDAGALSAIIAPPKERAHVIHRRLGSVLGRS